MKIGGEIINENNENNENNEYVTILKSELDHLIEIIYDVNKKYFELESKVADIYAILEIYQKDRYQN